MIITSCVQRSQSKHANIKLYKYLVRTAKILRSTQSINSDSKPVLGCVFATTWGLKKNLTYPFKFCFREFVKIFEQFNENLSESSFLTSSHTSTPFINIINY